MSNLVVVGVDNAAAAFQMRAALANMQTQYLIEMEDAVVVTRAADAPCSPSGRQPHRREQGRSAARSGAR